MTEPTYWLILLIVNGVLAFMGLHLIFGIISKELKGGTYHAARQLAGGAITVGPVAGYIFYYLEQTYNNNPDLATAVNLTTYYITATLLAISFLSLIGHKSDKLKSKFLIFAISFLLYMIPTWGPLIFKYNEFVKMGHIISNILLAICLITLCIFLYIIYSRLLNRIDNYYSDNIASHIKWISNSIFLFIGLSIIACISPFSNYYSIWLCLLYEIFQFIVYIYIYMSIIKFESATLSLTYNEEEEDINPIPAIPFKSIKINLDTQLYIEKELMTWINNKRYLTPGITVKSVAQEIFTNRTYISSYINSQYNCSFKVWISKLRIEEAKRILCSNNELSTNQVAEQVGFASTSSFISVFKNSEHLTPIKWREMCIKFRDNQYN